MIQDNPYRQQDIDSVMNILYTTMKTTKATIRIAGEDKPSMAVIGKLMKLDKESILYAVDKFSEQTERIKSPAAYMLTILYNAPEQYHLDMKNQVNNEKVKADRNEQTKKKPDFNKKTLGSFSNNHQRTYDYEELEKELLNTISSHNQLETD